MDDTDWRIFTKLQSKVAKLTKTFLLFNKNITMQSLFTTSLSFTPRGEISEIILVENFLQSPFKN